MQTYEMFGNVSLGVPLFDGLDVASVWQNNSGQGYKQHKHGYVSDLPQ